MRRVSVKHVQRSRGVVYPPFLPPSPPSFPYFLNGNVRQHGRNDDCGVCMNARSLSGFYCERNVNRLSNLRATQTHTHTVFETTELLLSCPEKELNSLSH